MAATRRIKRSTVDVRKITIEEAHNEYIKELRVRNLSEDTIRNYNTTYKLFMEFFEYDDESTLSEITQSSLYEWIGSIKLDGVKITTINSYITNMKVFFKWCMDEDRAYMEPFKFPKLKGQEEPIKLYSDEDVEKLLEKPRNPDNFVETRNWVIVNWVLATGNRGATIAEVKIGDVDFKTKEITLRHTKNKKAQTIPLSPALETILKKYIKEWRGNDDDKYLFPGVGDEKMLTNSLRKSFAIYCRDRGVEQTNLHGLRHNFAKYWVLNGGNVFALQKILGHSTLDMTRRYVKLFGEDLKEDFDKFSALDVMKKKSKRTVEVKRGQTAPRFDFSENFCYNIYSK